MRICVYACAGSRMHNAMSVSYNDVYEYISNSGLFKMCRWLSCPPRDRRSNRRCCYSNLLGLGHCWPVASGLAYFKEPTRAS